MPKSPILAITGGGDWYDASVDFLITPEGRNAEEDVEKYKLWYREHMNIRPRLIEYQSLASWLTKEFGYTDAEGSEDFILVHEDF